MTDRSIRKAKTLGLMAGLGAMLLTAPVSAGVREGVEAWSRGDYGAAVAEWEGPANAGNPDAMFNLAQAFRLGRGVPQDQLRAEQLYAGAAQAGHSQAADIYGLMLFQDGRREQALPYVLAAAERGDPRAQYLLGVAHFNGELVARDWVRAYALLTLANAEGLPQATGALGQMDQHVPLEQRQRGVALAQELKREADAARNAEMAALDLGQQPGRASQLVDESVASAAPPPASVVTQPRSRLPRAIPSVSVSPSVAAARQAVEQARQATGAGDPAQAGASYAARAPQAAPSAPVVAQPAPAPAPRPAPQPAVAAAQPAASGPWRVQLGAFGVAANADRLWASLARRPELAGRQKLLVPAGNLTKLQIGGFASQAQAQAACNSLKAAGQNCLVTR